MLFPLRGICWYLKMLVFFHAEWECVPPHSPATACAPPACTKSLSSSPCLLGCVLSAGRARALGGCARAQPDSENPRIELWLGMGRWGTDFGSEPGANAAAQLLNPLAAPACTPRTLEMLLGGSRAPPTHRQQAATKHAHSAAPCSIFPPKKPQLPKTHCKIHPSVFRLRAQGLQ